MNGIYLLSFLVGLPNQRRDSLTGSLDAYKQRQLTQYYGALGTGSTSPHAGPMGLVPAAQSLTPPPSLSASTNSLNLGGNYTGGWTVAWGGDSLSRPKDDGNFERYLRVLSVFQITQYFVDFKLGL